MNDFKPDIWRLQTQFDIEGLVGALESGESSTRRRAASALRALGAFHTIPALRTALKRETDSSTRSVLLATLTSLESERQRQKQSDQQPQPTAESNTEAQRCIKQLESSDTCQVIAAVKALGKMGYKPAVEPLVILFKDGRAPIKVRLAAAETLLKLECATVEVALLGALQSKNWRVRCNSAAILGQLNADWAVEPLIKALKDEHESVRNAVRTALERIDTPDARAALEAVTAGKSAGAEAIEEEPGGAEAAEEKPTASESSPADLNAAGKSDDEDDKIVWPRRHQRGDPTMMPTRPLDPRTLELLNARYEGKFPPANSETTTEETPPPGEDP